MQYQNLLAPVHRLPPEIVAEIFLYFAPVRLGIQGFMQPYHHPWHLGRICKSWRTIALSLGRLWSVFDITPYSRSFEDRVEITHCTTDEEQDERAFTSLTPRKSVGWYDEDHEAMAIREGFSIETTLRFIDALIQRSGNRPLSLRLIGPDSVVFDQLLKYSARWEQLVWYTPLSHGLKQVYGLTLPSLSTLTCFKNAPEQYTWAPGLTSLSLCNIDMDSTCDQIPWSQLTRYEESDCGWLHYPRRLASYRQLTNLRVLLMSVDADSSPLPPNGVVLPCLQAASFYSTRPEVIKVFNMPALEAYKLTYHMAWHSRQVRCYTPRESTQLQIFRVEYHCYGGGVPPDAWDQHSLLQRVIETYPQLKEVTIDCPEGLISSAALSLLIPSQGRLPMAPGLEVIRFADRSFARDGWWKPLAELLNTRFKPAMQSISPLRCFEIIINDYRDRDGHIVKALKTLRNRWGWDIRIGDECSARDVEEDHGRFPEESPWFD